MLLAAQQETFGTAFWSDAERFGEGFNFREIDSLAEPLRVAAERSPESLVLRGEQQQYLEDGLRLLTVKERTALLLRDVEDLPAEQVAKQLGCSMATVRSHIANARIKFRRYMERRKA